MSIFTQILHFVYVTLSFHFFLHLSRYVGTLTGVQKGAVTISVDSRFDDNRDAFLVHWLKNPSDSAQLLSQTLRSNLEQNDVRNS